MKTPILFAVLLLAVAHAATAAEFHVAPAGDDHNPGNGRKPFKTIERARAQIQNLKASGKLPDGGVKIWMHGGRYEQNQPLPFGTEDSGIPGKPIVWLAFPGEKPVVGKTAEIVPLQPGDRP